MKVLHLACATAALVLAGQAFAQTSPASSCSANAAAHRMAVSEDKDIVQTAAANGNFGTLLAAAKAAGLVDALKADGPLTVFAPTDEAFARLPKGTVEELLKPENKAKLTSILTYHVVAGKLGAAVVTKTSGAMTLQGQRLSFKVSGDQVMVDGATVSKADVMAKNGVIHVIDHVLMPTDKSIVDVAAGAGTFATLIAAAKAAGLAETLATGGPFTVFAPNDEAFAKLPKGTVEGLLKPENKEKLASILKLHVVAGRVDSIAAASVKEATSLSGGKLAIVASDGGLTVGGAKVVAADINASNGLIHVIDTVILPK